MKTAVNLINDESVATAPPDGILVGAGAIGEIVRVAMHTEARVPIYLVGFGERLVVGCLEEEITIL
ncbi:nitrogen fixation protein NifZ [Bradyrhizobium sp. 141]|nr:nitrogen fixation protein NifZ [Bradyrhizobium sp. 141]